MNGKTPDNSLCALCSNDGWLFRSETHGGGHGPAQDDSYTALTALTQHTWAEVNSSLFLGRGDLCVQIGTEWCQCCKLKNMTLSVRYRKHSLFYFFHSRTNCNRLGENYKCAVNSCWRIYDTNMALPHLSQSLFSQRHHFYCENICLILKEEGK